MNEYTIEGNADSSCREDIVSGKSAVDGGGLHDGFGLSITEAEVAATSLHPSSVKPS